MPRRHTTQEVNGFCTNLGIKFVDKEYINNRTRHLFQCSCGKQFRTTLNMAKQGDKLNCGRCNLPKIGEKFNNWTVVEVIEDINKKGGKVIFDCDCGKTRRYEPHHWSEITKGKSRSCGHCADPEIGDKSNRLTVIEIKPSKYNGCEVKCICDCGNTTKWMKGYRFTNGNDISCGRCREPKIGDKFGRLTTIKINSKGPNGCSIVFQCDCGQKCEPIFAAVYQGHVQSCGNCQLKRNGRFTSQKALKLHSMVEEVIGPCEHNYNINGTHFDIVSIDKKIVVEFDGYYWHRIKSDLTIKDKQDIKKAQASGYRVLRIRSDGNELPTKLQLEKVLLNHFAHGYKKWTITLPSWKERKAYYEAQS